MVGSALDGSFGEGSVLSGHSTFVVRYLSNSFILAGLIVTVDGVGVVVDVVVVVVVVVPQTLPLVPLGMGQVPDVSTSVAGG